MFSDNALPLKKMKAFKIQSYQGYWGMSGNFFFLWFIIPKVQRSPEIYLFLNPKNVNVWFKKLIELTLVCVNC